MHKCVCTSSRSMGEHKVSCSIVPCLVPLRQVFSLNLEVGWWPASPVILLPPSVTVLGFQAHWFGGFLNPSPDARTNTLAHRVNTPALCNFHLKQHITKKVSTLIGWSLRLWQQSHSVIVGGIPIVGAVFGGRTLVGGFWPSVEHVLPEKGSIGSAPANQHNAERELRWPGPLSFQETQETWTIFQRY